VKYISEIITYLSEKILKDHDIHIDTDNLYQTFIWSISNDPEFLLVALKSASKNFSCVYNNKLDGIDSILVNCYKDTLYHKFKDKDILLQAILEITCFEKDGVNIIKKALILGSEIATDMCPFKIKLVKSPFYSIMIRTSIKEPAIKLINEAIQIIKENLNRTGAIFKIVKIPEIILDKEFEPEESNEDLDYE